MMVQEFGEMVLQEIMECMLSGEVFRRHLGLLIRHYVLKWGSLSELRLWFIAEILAGGIISHVIVDDVFERYKVHRLLRKKR